MMPGRMFGTLLSGMWHGYRRWMTLFNATSIVLSVCLAVVILSFAHGVRAYVNDMVRKEAAAGAVRIHLSGWQPAVVERSFLDRVRSTDAALRESPAESGYNGFNVWWRSEAHFLSLNHPAIDEGRGIFAKMGNTYPDDPEAVRVTPYVVAGQWVTDETAREIVLSAEAALKLSHRLPAGSRMRDLVGRTIWIVLPGTQEHAPAACAQVRVTGIFEHMRDQACMTTPAVIQEMFARIKANANGKWFETYDRMAYSIESIRTARDVIEADPSAPPPLLCWRVRDYADAWVHLSGELARWAEPADVRALRDQARDQAQRAAEAADAGLALRTERDQALLFLDSRDENMTWLDDLRAKADAAFPETGTSDPSLVTQVQSDLVVAASSLDLDPGLGDVADREGFLAAYAGVAARIDARFGELEARVEDIRTEMSDTAARGAAAEAESLRLLAEADALSGAASNDTSLEIRAAVTPGNESVAFSAPQRDDLPPSPVMAIEDLDARHPGGYVLCSPRVWADLGYEAAPLLEVEPWRESALYAYLYFEDLTAAQQARPRLQEWGFETYMPIDKFHGLVSVVRLITWGSLALLAAVLFAGLLGIAITLYTEVDAEEREIGLLKALGASNRLVGGVFLLKGGLIGLIGVVAGVPLAWVIGARINQIVSGAVAQSVGLTNIQEGFFSREPWMVMTVGITVVMLAALAALMPALQAARKDPQEALRAE